MEVTQDKSLMDVKRVTEQVSKRERLQAASPISLAENWADQLHIDAKDVMHFFRGCVLRYLMSVGD